MIEHPLVKSGIIDNVKKIAILRANALGDFIVTIPAILAIRAAYPHAELVLLGSPWHKEFLSKGRTPIDKVLIVPPIKGIREGGDEFISEEETNTFFSNTQKEAFDIAIHFQGQGFAANPFIKRLGAKVTAGHSAPDAEHLDYNLHYYYYQNEISRYLEVAALIGAKPVTLEPKIEILGEDKIELKQFLEAENILKGIVVIHSCGTDPRRMWEFERYSQVADQISQKGFQVIFTGSAKDMKDVENIISNTKHSAINACGKLSLGGLSALLNFSKLVISIDTGPLHLAQAVGSKSIGLYWAPNIINWGPITRKNHHPLISWTMQCPYCGITPNHPHPFLPENICDHPFSFIKDITVEQVIAAANILLPE